jgi:hypothetical protein
MQRGMTEWEQKVRFAKGKWTRGPVGAGFSREHLTRDQDAGWDLCATVPVTQLSFTSLARLFQTTVSAVRSPPFPPWSGIW